MKRKQIVLTTLACLISLAIGVVIGIGINQKNLFGTGAGSVGSIQNMNGTFTVDGKTIDLGTLLLELGTQRAGEFDKQIADQMNSIKEQNNKLKEANEIMAKMREAKSGKKEMSEEIYNYFTKNGLNIVGATGQILKDEEWDSNITAVKDKIDAMNSDSQFALTSMQALINKRNQSFELMTNMLQRDQKTRDSIVGNLR